MPPQAGGLHGLSHATSLQIHQTEYSYVNNRERAVTSRYEREKILPTEMYNVLTNINQSYVTDTWIWAYCLMAKHNLLSIITPYNIITHYVYYEPEPLWLSAVLQ